MDIFGFSIKQIEKKEPSFDHKHYGENLKSILTLARDEYKSISLDWRNRQSFILRTYLWLAVTLMAGQTSLFIPVWGNKVTNIFPYALEANFGFYFFAIPSLVSSLAAFVMGIDSFRGREFICLSHQSSFDNLMMQSYKEANNKEPTNNVLILQIKELNLAIEKQKKQVTWIGNRLRKISYIFLASLTLSIISLLPIKDLFIGNTKKEVISMAEESKKPAPPPPTEVQVTQNPDAVVCTESYKAPISNKIVGDSKSKPAK